MPNTIAHFAINGLFTRSVINHADFKWIYLGCIVPDIPWILQRLTKYINISVDLYDLRAYCIVQSSFLLCIFLCAAFAMFAKQRGKVFIILIIGSLLHLLLDAVQIKWANGVQLFAPFNWNLLRFDLFWPESLATYLLTGLGLLYLVFNISKSIQPNCDEFVFSTKFMGLGSVMFVAWLVLPIAYIPSVYAADNHYINTLKDVDNRAEKRIEIDRNVVIHADAGYQVLTAYGELISVKNVKAEHGELISLQGSFIDKESIYVEDYHLHSKFRVYASMFGLACVLLIWLLFISRCCVQRLREIR